MKLEEKLNELKEKGLEVFSYPDNIQCSTIVEISTRGVPELEHGFHIDSFFRDIITKGFEDYTLFGFTKVVIYLTMRKKSNSIEVKQ